MERISMKALLLAVTTVGLTVSAADVASAQISNTNPRDSLQAQIEIPLPRIIIPNPLRPYGIQRDDDDDRHDNDPGKRSDGSWQERQYDRQYDNHQSDDRWSDRYGNGWRDGRENLQRDLNQCDRRDDRDDYRECVDNVYGDYYRNQESRLDDGGWRNGGRYEWEQRRVIPSGIPPYPVERRWGQPVPPGVRPYWY